MFHAEGYYGGVCDCVTCLARYWLFPLFCLYVWNGQCLWYSWRLSIVTAIRSGPCSILGLLANLRAVLSHRTPIPVLLYLYSFDFRTIPGYLRFFGAGVRGERLFVDKRYKKGKANNQIQNNLSNLSKPMIQHGSERFKVTRPVSQFGPGIVCSSHANTSQGKYRDHGWPICTWAHVAIVTLYNATTRRDENVL